MVSDESLFFGYFVTLELEAERLNSLSPRGHFLTPIGYFRTILVTKAKNTGAKWLKIQRWKIDAVASFSVNFELYSFFEKPVFERATSPLKLVKRNMKVSKV